MWIQVPEMELKLLGLVVRTFTCWAVSWTSVYLTWLSISVCLCVYLSIHVSIHPSMYLSFFLNCICVCVCARALSRVSADTVCQSAHMEVRGQLEGVSSLLPCSTQGSNLGPQAWCQVPLSAEPISLALKKILFWDKVSYSPDGLGYLVSESSLLPILCFHLLAISVTGVRYQLWVSSQDFEMMWSALNSRYIIQM